ncbi:LysR family transcriptional regulator [Piscinibacter gummiphilus]|uniref:LysR family transcriptional regulator n=1 Tax=Piscinibacter gummiphilus TaxID=946333 RepID=A0ABZ0CTI3_9BURK|nr:LysR family transcriptional regulator [Piscinibacter gummiphilus]WOB08284.1 LysR family transcriptional regulator [Piscinibacter gummiphilus]
MNFKTLDLNLLRVFDAVMAERNLTRAAARLALTQPAVSNALRRFRESVGEELLTRATHGVVPTPFAEKLWPQVRAALDQLRAALDPGEFDPHRDAVSFRLAMADATAAVLLPPLIDHIEAEQALVNLRVIPLTTRDPRALVERGEIDVAVGYFPEAIAELVSQGAESALRHQRLNESEYVCVMRSGHPLAEGELTLDAFCQAHHLLVSFSGRPHGFVDQALASLNRTRRIVLTVNQFFTAGRVVARSDLLTVLPASFVVATGYQSQLVERPLPMPMARIHVEAMWHMRHDSVSAHQWLRERLVDASRPRPGVTIPASPHPDS